FPTLPVADQYDAGALFADGAAGGGQEMAERTSQRHGDRSRAGMRFFVEPVFCHLLQAALWIFAAGNEAGAARRLGARLFGIRRALPRRAPVPRWWRRPFPCPVG